jgi:hypothetical protein
MVVFNVAMTDTGPIRRDFEITGLRGAEEERIIDVDRVKAVVLLD